MIDWGENRNPRSIAWAEFDAVSIIYLFIEEFKTGISPRRESRENFRVMAAPKSACGVYLRQTAMHILRKRLKMNHQPAALYSATLTV